MRRFEVRVVGAILLIGVGILFLLQNLGVLGAISAILWALLFAVGSAVFFYVFLTDRSNWWAVIPGFVLLGIAGLIALSELAPEVESAWGGALFLGCIGLAFWVVYLSKREHWWAVIPGGVMVTTALVTGLSSIFEGAEMGGAFLIGLGLTFGLLSLLPTPEGRMKWALIPAAVLSIVGLLITAATASLLNYLWPAALILAGLYGVFRAFVPRRRE